ncbi:MAG: hypothetical protein JWR07_1262 [Nevskia sp.]|nr:hypothetical protein [Nevskia sp.]
MLETFCAWLERTPLSAAIQNVDWIIPVGQIIHILCLSVVLSSAVLLDFRVMGLAARRVSIPDMARRFLPWIWTALALMVLSGTVLIIGEPRRDLLNPAFQIKMILLLAAVAMTLMFHVSVRRGARIWEEDRKGNLSVRLAAAATLSLWIGIAICGRLIAYFMAG